MPLIHLIEQGDSVSSLALRYGLAPDTIWMDGANADLRAIRSRADALLPDDQLTIPELRAKSTLHAIDARHRFRRVGVPILFELQLFDQRGVALAGRSYTLEVDGADHQDRTDATGYLKQYIPNDARQGRVTIDGEVDRAVHFGHLDPIETLIGVQKRLSNLGFHCVQDQGAMARATVVALLRFQQMTALPVNGKLDDATREEVRACHDDRSHFEQHMRRIAAPPSA